MEPQNKSAKIDNELYYLATLSGCNGIGSKLTRLLEKMSPKELWAASETDLISRDILSSANIASYLESRKKLDVDKTAQQIEKLGIKITHIYSDTYPDALRAIPKPPIILFYKGKYGLDIFDKSIAVVGTRNPTDYGVKATDDIVSSLAAEGINIVSGMAMGIDSEAHKATLDSGGTTTAILGCGLNIVYPASNRKLYERIIENGLIISEFLPSVTPQQWHFPQRNRLISGLSKGVIVIEGSHDSGSISTVEHALEQGRTVFALPGSIYTKQSEAPNKLIKDGAVPILRYTDILDELDWSSTQTKSEKVKVKNKQNKLDEDINKLAGLEKNILELFKSSGESTLSAEYIHQKLNSSASEVSMALLQLELSDIITKKSGGLYSLLG